jgi:hypothetical protein
MIRAAVKCKVEADLPRAAADSENSSAGSVVPVQFRDELP